MKRKYTTTILATALLFSLGGCVKDELHDTPHPDEGVVAVAIDVPQGDEEEEGAYTVEIDGTTADGKEGRYTVSDPLPPGEYTVLAYNTPQGFTVTDGIARVERTDGTVRALTDFINPLPDYLYSGTERITVVADDTLRMNLDVTQRVRDLHIELTVTEGDPERIAAIAGTLSGVAEAYDLRNETLYGEAVSTRPTFTRSGDKVSAELRLLGVLGDVQTLTLVLTFTDGQTQTVESDLTEILADFNGDMEEALGIEGELHTPVRAGMEATIKDWNTIPGDPVEAM